MNEKLKKSIVEGDANITISISASDLREIVSEIVAGERERIAKEVELQKQKPTLSIADATSILGVSNKTLYLWEKSGYLTPVRIGRKVMYRAADIDEIMAKSQTC